jgi:hypothetical protein
MPSRAGSIQQLPGRPQVSCFSPAYPQPSEAAEGQRSEMPGLQGNPMAARDEPEPSSACLQSRRSPS